MLKKYLKYKNKYLSLKYHFGGTFNTNINCTDRNIITTLYATSINITPTQISLIISKCLEDKDFTIIWLINLFVHSEQNKLEEVDITLNIFDNTYNSKTITDNQKSSLTYIYIYIKTFYCMQESKFDSVIKKIFSNAIITDCNKLFQLFNISKFDYIARLCVIKGNHLNQNLKLYLLGEYHNVKIDDSSNDAEHMYKYLIILLNYAPFCIDFYLEELFNFEYINPTVDEEGFINNLPDINSLDYLRIFSKKHCKENLCNIRCHDTDLRKSDIQSYKNDKSLPNISMPELKKVFTSVFNLNDMVGMVNTFKTTTDNNTIYAYLSLILKYIIYSSKEGMELYMSPEKDIYIQNNILLQQILSGFCNEQIPKISEDFKEKIHDIFYYFALNYILNNANDINDENYKLIKLLNKINEYSMNDSLFDNSTLYTDILKWKI